MSRLPVSRLVSLSINLSPQAAQGANLNALLILGSSDVIDVSERMRAYATITEVGNDFGTTAPEYLAAALYFEQSPQPQNLYIGRWAKAATSGIMHGGILTTAEQAMANWTAITTGGVDLTVDGVAHNLTLLDFSAQTTLNGVASVITTALAGAATVTWDGYKFNIESSTTGVTSTIAYATAGGGTDISAMLKFTSTTASVPVAGIGAETLLASVQIFFNTFSTKFFGLMVADSTVSDADHEAVAGYIEADQLHVYGITTQNTNVLDSTVTTDLASTLKGLSYDYTFITYSSYTPYAAASFFGRAFTVDFNGSNTTLTMMYKQEPGILPEALTTTQADTLENKRCNVYVYYNNDTAIIQYGTMSGSVYFDDIYNLAWLRDRVQTDCYNLLYTSGTKIPQTDAGNHIVATTIESGLVQGVNNGMIAPGQWNAGGFGTLKQGDFLPKGYYIYTPPISSQAQADRDARKSVSFQIALKLAGAIHTLNIALNVNR